MLPSQYFLGDIFPDEVRIKYLRNECFPNNIFVFEIFKYLGILIFGLIILKIETESFFTGKKDKNNEVRKELKNEIELIYEENNQYPIVSVISLFLLLLLFIVEMKLIDIHFLFILVGLDFWMLEIIFVVIINILLFKNKLYIHQKSAFVFILFFSSIMKIISIIFIFKDGEEKIYIKYTWIVPIGIIFFILLYLLDAYIICKMKWYFDLKFISEKKVLIFLGIMGLLIFLICSLISNFIECQENDYTSLFCTAYEDENSPKYVDNFSIFFKNIWKEDRTPFVNCVYILIILLLYIFSRYFI